MGGYGGGGGYEYGGGNNQPYAGGYQPQSQPATGFDSPSGKKVCPLPSLLFPFHLLVFYRRNLEVLNLCVQ